MEDRIKRLEEEVVKYGNGLWTACSDWNDIGYYNSSTATELDDPSERSEESGSVL